MMAVTRLSTVRAGQYAAVLLGAMIAAPIAQAAPDGWTCEAGICTAEAETAITRLDGVFDHGANLSRTMQVDRVAELEQQRWREFRFSVLSPARIYARAKVDPGYTPADWPGDISLGNVGVDVSRHYSVDGESYTKIDDGFVLPAGAYLSVVVGQQTWAGGSSYATYYPASWTLDVTAKRVEAEADLAAVDLTQLPILSDDAIKPLGQSDDSDIDLDAAIDATSPCEGAECRPPSDAPSAIHSDGTPVLGDPVDPNAAVVPDSDDPSLLIDPDAGDCGQGMLECKPEPEAEFVAQDESQAEADATKPDPLATELQAELARVGCYDLAIDGLWGPGSRRAMTNFNHWAGKDAPVNEPTPKALVTVARTPGPVCGVD